MNAKKAIETIKLMLGMETEAEAVEVSLAEVELVDGTIVKTEGELATGAKLLVATPDGDIPAPEGVHETKDGMLVQVDAEGTIVSVEEKESEEAPVEEAMSDESGSFSDEMIGAIAELIKPLNDKLAAMESKFSSLNNEFNTFRDEPAGEKVTNNYFQSEETINKNERLDAIRALRNKKK